MDHARRLGWRGLWAAYRVGRQVTGLAPSALIVACRWHWGGSRIAETLATTPLGPDVRFKAFVDLAPE